MCIIDRNNTIIIRKKERREIISIEKILFFFHFQWKCCNGYIYIFIRYLLYIHMTRKHRHSFLHVGMLFYWMKIKFYQMQEGTMLILRDRSTIIRSNILYVRRNAWFIELTRIWKKCPFLAYFKCVLSLIHKTDVSSRRNIFDVDYYNVSLDPTA